MRLGLDSIDRLCERLDRPERRVPSVLVAGTNGKGSTAATLSAIAAAAGLQAGLYTSPHLIAVTERIRIGEADISPAELDGVLGVVFAASDETPRIPLTYFEALTAAAFVAFAEQRLALAILEVGLGGRLDATNVAPASLSVVTSISLDHVEELGPTVASIAREKAGIFRRGRPALVETRLEQARVAFRTVAAETGAVLHEMSDETSLTIEEISFVATRFRLRTPERLYALSTPLLGQHQASNAATAARAAELLEADVRITAEAIVRGVRAVRWPGRLESFRVGGRPVLIDGCHNPDGAAALARFLERAGIEADLVFGAMADKDIGAMVGALAKSVGQILVVPIDSPRAATTEEVRRRVSESRPDARPVRGLEAALRELLSRPGGKPIIIAGSLYLVGQARALLLSGRLERT
jgi:dihydrofolate synthase / folylpolyglutamate synthase